MKAKSRYSMIILHIHHLTGFKEKSIGLITAKKPYPILMYTRFGIHTFGMKHAIDVVVLSKRNSVVKLSKGLQPNKLFLWNPLYNKVIELPVGGIKKRGIKMGSVLSLRFI